MPLRIMLLKPNTVVMIPPIKIAPNAVPNPLIPPPAAKAIPTIDAIEEHRKALGQQANA